jgi:hypothetical protein
MAPTRRQDASTGRWLITTFERRQLAVEALGMDERTVAAAYANPRQVRESTLLRLTKAAKKLGLPAPTDGSSFSRGQK